MGCASTLRALVVIPLHFTLACFGMVTFNGPDTSAFVLGVFDSMSHERCPTLVSNLYRNRRLESAKSVQRVQEPTLCFDNSSTSSP